MTRGATVQLPRWATRDLARLDRATSGRQVLVTGATGFIGRWLVAYLRAAGVSVLPLARRGAGGLRAWRCDLETEPDRLARRLARRPPAVVFHLAAPEPSAEGDTVGLVESGLRQTQHLIEGCAGCPRPPRFIQVSSSAVYGPSGGLRLDEAHPPAPANFHGVGKLLSEALVTRAQATAGLPVVRVRPFNVVGPGQAATRVLPRMAEQVVAREAGRSRSAIQTRGLDGVRDFVDVRDTVSALVAVATRGENGGVYNICRGQGVRVGRLLEQLVAMAGLPDLEVVPQGDHGVDASVGDPTRLRALGWRPRYGLRQTVGDVLEEWRRR